ncbi:MAG: cysteine desulfurase [Clostridia bacterium]|nr:cysteine desulfurase [Clostridia bacterium]
MKHIIYLDNSATTKPSKKACEYINKALTDNWGNPSSLHTMGIDAEITVDNARECIARKIGARADEIIFTGSGTEANNTAVLSALARKNRGNRVITSAIEHPSVLETVKRLENEGFEVIRLGCDSSGKINLDELEKALNDKTVLVSIMLVNNEVGSIQPIAMAGGLVRKLSPNALFHTDAVQGFGKMDINVKKLGVDLLTASAHKIHGPKGIGFLYCKKGINIAPFITGGGQERGMRSGTEAVPLIAGFMGAAEELGDISRNLADINELNLYAREVFSNSGFAEINSPEDALPYILNISVTGYRSETLLHFLESRGIFVSSGSACAKGEASYVLKALGLDKKHSDSALRLSFSKNNTKEDIDLTVAALEEATKKLRRSDI